MKTLMNEQIRDKNVLLILSDGSKHGLVDRDVAMQMARDEDMDLVCVSQSNNGKPSVCKILDYGKEQYRKQKNARKSHHSQSGVMKEVQFSLNISDHDMEIKHKNVKKFLDKGQLVRYIMRLKGRQKRNPEYAKEVFQKRLDELSDIATWEKVQASESRILTTLSKKK